MLDLRDKNVTVAGLGRFGGGTAVTRWLVEQGAHVLVTDRDPADKLSKSLDEIKDLPIAFRLGEHRVEDFEKADLVVANPAIPPTNEFLAAARATGVPVTSEICLFVERCPATILGVTGTKGKSTTTALLGEMLKTKFNTIVGGNIGRSLLPELANIRKTDLVVLELSSFMLEYLGEMRFSPHVAVVTMLAADHLEWHGSAAAYLEAKRNVVKYQRTDDFAVLNEENEGSIALATSTVAKVVRFGLNNRRPIELILPGWHNQLNAQAAYAAAGVMGVSFDDAQTAVRNFKGLPHRLELVHESNGVRFYNDSIATIPEAAIAAMDSFPAKSVIQIVGGHDKGLPLTAMCNALIERAKAVLCIGETGETLAQLCNHAGQQFPSSASIYRCGDLATAMKEAKLIATRGDIVLLSPGFSSYDQFDNFQQRGEMFSQLARGD